MDTVIIAIDGQASTGKSTQAKKLAENLKYDYRDSGAYYRAITLYLLDNDIKFDLNISDKILDKINIKQTYENNIEQLKNNINFFEDSISLINNIKGEE